VGERWRTLPRGRGGGAKGGILFPKKKKNDTQSEDPGSRGKNAKKVPVHIGGTRKEGYSGTARGEVLAGKKDGPKNLADQRRTPFVGEWISKLQTLRLPLNEKN